MRKLNKQQQRRIHERQSKNSEANLLQAIVISRHKNHALISDQPNSYLLCNIRQNIGDVVVGDQVLYSQQESSNKGLIHSIRTRSSLLAQKSKLIAANINQLLIVSATEPSWDSLLVDSFILIAEKNHITPIIILNKSDLLSHDNHFISIYQQLGYQVVLVSATTGKNIDQLTQLIEHQSNAFVGLSGVGKSSISNALIPNLNQQTQLLTKAKHGSHTTSTSQLFWLPGGGNIIDSPGIREITLEMMDLQTIESGFREFSPYMGQCKYHNCRHQHEPECAIKNAINDNKISRSRYQSYLHFIDNHLQI